MRNLDKIQYFGTMVTFHLICGYVSWIKLFLITFKFNLFSMELLANHNTMFLTIKDKTKFAFIFLKNIYIPIFYLKMSMVFKVLVFVMVFKVSSTSFGDFFQNIVKEGETEKWDMKICPNYSFSIIFLSDCPKKIKFWFCIVYCFESVWRHVMACPVTMA